MISKKYFQELFRTYKYKNKVFEQARFLGASYVYAPYIPMQITNKIRYKK